MQRVVAKGGKLRSIDLSKTSNPNLSSRQLSDDCCSMQNIINGLTLALAKKQSKRGCLKNN